MIRRLPIFPLGMVLLPGVTVPLHLFEPRYRRLLADIRDGDRQFGIILGLPGVAERDLPPGRVGCIARVIDIEALPDGRANILVTGGDRFALRSFVDDPAPYHVADVESLPDASDAAPVALAVAADEVLSRFRRVVAAVRVLGDDDDPAPSLPDDPGALSYAIASLIDIENTSRQALLAEPSPARRLDIVDTILRKVLPDLELRAAMHKPGETEE